MALSYQNLSLLVTSPSLLSRLDGSENNVGFQWLGPHFLSFLHYTTELCLFFRYKNDRSSFLDHVSELCLCFKHSDDRFSDLLKRLDDSAYYCVLYGDAKHYRKFLKLVLSFMPELREFFTVQKMEQLANWTGIRDPTVFVLRFIGVLVQKIGDILNSGTDYRVLVSNQVKVLLNELKFLHTFLADTIRCRLEENENILTEIEAVSNEAGLFLHSFFFTTERITMAQMDQALSVLLESVEIVQVKIKYHWIATSKKLNCGTGSILQVAESSSEISSQDKSIPVVEEIIDIVGFEKITTKIARKLIGGPNNRQIISIVGMPGLGKTTLAKKLYNDFNVRSHFDKLSWCVVSQIYTKKRLVIDILSSISNHPSDKILEMKDGDLFSHLYQCLKGLRYLIVMDDIWDKEAWNDLTKLFPDDNTGSRILITSRLRNVASEISHVIIQPLPLSEGDSWDLLEQKVFKNERCPQELQDIGKQIAANCKGLPLLVVVIAAVLSNVKISLWEQVASNTSSYISKKDDGYLSILKLSYENLPMHLKPCFLYLNAFKEDKEVPVRKLSSLWVAEGFIEKKDQKRLEEVAEEYLLELIDRNLLQVYKRRSDNGVKSCTVHDLILDVCWKVAEEENFIFKHQFLVSKHQHRLCMDQSHHLSEFFSILYNSEKIKILELPSIYTRNDLLGITVMSELSYLEIYSLESSIGRLEKLDFLSAKVEDEIQMYLLNLPKLRHLHVGSCNRPTKFNENCNSSRINCLQTLSFIYISNSKDEEILNCSPNLRSLKCKSSPDRCPNLNFLTQLMSLKMEFERSFIGNYSEVNFPKNIRKLTLSKMGFPWEKISELIGTLPNLEILKLEWDAFKGEVWNTKDDEFQKLKFLKLDCLDLKKWNSSYDHFPVLERLVLRACYNLEMIPSELSAIPTLQMIEIHSCGNGVKKSALEIREEQKDFGNKKFEVY